MPVQSYLRRSALPMLCQTPHTLAPPTNGSASKTSTARLQRCCPFSFAAPIFENAGDCARSEAEGQRSLTSEATRTCEEREARAEARAERMARIGCEELTGKMATRM